MKEAMRPGSAGERKRNPLIVTNAALIEVETPIGLVRILADEHGVTEVRLPRTTLPERAGGTSEAMEESHVPDAQHATDARHAQGNANAAMCDAARVPPPAAVRHAERCAAQLLEWFAGSRTTFDVALHPSLTPFQVRVLDACSEISPGSVETYGSLAMRIGVPGAARAVAGALSRNPIPLLVPCHRIVGAGGKPVGFMGVRNNPLQLRLLEVERHG